MNLFAKFHTYKKKYFQPTKLGTQPTLKHTHEIAY